MSDAKPQEVQYGKQPATDSPTVVFGKQPAATEVIATTPQNAPQNAPHNTGIVPPFLGGSPVPDEPTGPEND
jgi:hypothetical protein